MNAQHTILFSKWMLAPLLACAASGQPAGGPRSASSAMPPSGAPSITILPAATGGLVRSERTGSASLDLGRVSYFSGALAPGASSKKTTGALVISTRFALKVDCPGNSSSVQVNVTMSRTDAAATHTLAIDGIRLGTSARTLDASMPCGSRSEHHLEMEVPVSTPAGPIGSNIAFEATLRK